MHLLFFTLVTHADRETGQQGVGKEGVYDLCTVVIANLCTEVIAL